MEPQRVEELVIGSGFGGSVIAARRAAAGRQVLVLERGPWWRTRADGLQPVPAERARVFPRGGASSRLLRHVEWRTRHGAGMARLLHADGLFDVHRSPGLAVFCGSGVGGGSHVYTNMLVEPRRAFFAAFPGPLRDQVYWRDRFDRVREVLQPRPWPYVLCRWRHWPGVRWERPGLAVAPPDQGEYINAAGVRQRACTGCGECIIGCPHGAKTTLDLTYLQQALQNGARIEALVEVESIRAVDGGYLVRARDHQCRVQRTWLARRVFVCAGTLNTLRLMFRSRAEGGLPACSAMLGRRVGANGDLLGLLGVSGDAEDAPGPSIAAIFPRVDDRWLVAEGVIPWPRGRRSAAVLSRLALLLGMGDDGCAGAARWRRGGLQLDFDRRLAADLYDGLEAQMSELARRAGARLRWFNVPMLRASRSRATVHLVGGCRVGDTPERGVIDTAGQVFGHPGLYVVDGAALPAAPGTPPSLAIAAFAEHVAERIPRD